MGGCVRACVCVCVRAPVCVCVCMLCVKHQLEDLCMNSAFAFAVSYREKIERNADE